MNKIYVTIVSIAALLISVNMQAQVTVGVGYNQATTIEKAQDTSESDNLGGFYLEGTYDFNFLHKSWGKLALQPGLRLSYVGESDSDEEMGVKTKVSLKETYLDIPVSVKYSYGFNEVSVFGFAGPVFSFGMTSTIKTTIKGDNIDGMSKYYNYSGKHVTKGDLSNSASKGDGTTYGAFDVKLGLGLGVTLKDKLDVKFGYNIGLMNRYKGEQVENYKYTKRTNVLCVGLGWHF